MRIHHLALRTQYVRRLEAFYCDVLGLPVASKPGEERVWLDAEGTIVMIELRESGEPDIDARSLDLVAFSIKPEERTAFERRLSNAGVALEGETAFTLYFRDPDGRRVAVSHYPVPLA